MVDSVELREQRDVWQQGKQYQWLGSQMILSVEKAEKSVTTGQGHHTVDYLEKEGYIPSIFKVQPTGPKLIAYRTIVSATLETT